MVRMGLRAPQTEGARSLLDVEKNHLNVSSLHAINTQRSFPFPNYIPSSPFPPVFAFSFPLLLGYRLMEHLLSALEEMQIHRSPLAPCPVEGFQTCFYMALSGECKNYGLSSNPDIRKKEDLKTEVWKDGGEEGKRGVKDKLEKDAGLHSTPPAMAGPPRR